jgi:hypothetical protein
MLEPHVTEIRQELADVRTAALRSSARPSPPGPLRRAVGNGFVRLGLRLGSDGSVPPSALRSESLEEAPAGASSVLLSARRTSAALPVNGRSDDVVWELAAPFGPRLGARVS